MIDEVEWMEQRPDALKDAPYFKASEDGTPRTVAQLVSDVENAAKLQGNLSESHIKVPPPDAAQEDIDAWRERILKADTHLIVKPEDHSPVPEAIDGYKDPQIEGFKEDTASARELALKNKWSQAQYEGFVHQMAADHKVGAEGRVQWLTDQATKITDTLGSAKADHIMRTAAALKEAHPEVSTALLDGQIDANIALAIDSLVHQMLDMGGEAGQFNDQAGAGGRVFTPGEALAKADEIRTEMMNLRQGSRRWNELQENLVDYTRLSRPH